MLIENLPAGELARRLREDGADLITGACTFRVRSSIAQLERELSSMYGAYHVADSPVIVDAVVKLEVRRSLRHPLQSRVKVWINDERELDGLRADGAYAVFESALNWGVALSEVAPLLVHAAVLERDGTAVVLPAPSGSGKSTLCAALACSGWRLFSDEMAIFGSEGSELLPNPRPVSLKNESIDVIRARFPDVRLGPVIEGTPKGNVAYMRAPRDSALRCQEAAAASLVVKPVYSAGAALAIRRLSRVEAFRLLTENAVNYASMLQRGFDVMTSLAERCGCYEVVYSDLDQAIATIGDLHRGHAAS